MKRIFAFVVLSGVILSMLYAQEAVTREVASPEKAVKVVGYIIDNKCAQEQKPESLAEFVKTHTRECAIMPECQASGYAIFADNALIKFDSESNKKIAEFLQDPENTLFVEILAQEGMEGLRLLSIENVDD